MINLISHMLKIPECLLFLSLYLHDVVCICEVVLSNHNDLSSMDYLFFKEEKQFKSNVLAQIE